ncbi:MAG: amidase family protein, partial [Patescibacteria group bacterium]
TLPFKFGERQDPVAMYQSDLLTVGANLAGVPAISLPIGFSESGLPVGGQIIAKKSAENVLISLAKKYQSETDYHERKPR